MEVEVGAGAEVGSKILSELSELNIGTVGKRGRISVKGVFDRGSLIVFIERDGMMYMASIDGVAGVALVEDCDRITLPKNVRMKLGLKEGDLFTIEDADDGEITIPLKNRIRKVKKVVVSVE